MAALDVPIHHREAVDKATALRANIERWNGPTPQLLLQHHADTRKVEIRREGRHNDEVNILSAPSRFFKGETSGALS